MKTSAHDMVQHSLWHQRVQTTNSEPVCPICGNPVQFVLARADGEIGWRCHLGHPVHTPVYAILSTRPCPFPSLHDGF